jgi:hypothetical protein
VAISSSKIIENYWIQVAWDRLTAGLASAMVETLKKDAS